VVIFAFLPLNLPEEEPPVGDWVGPKAGLDAVEKGKI
jgi:hypothetical protein